MSKLRKILNLPTPIEMGKSTSNYLPYRKITPDCKRYCWEDYLKDLKEKYPIRFFFFKTLKQIFVCKIFNNILNPIKNIKNYIKYNFLEKHHILDLSQPDNFYNIEVYKYGWCDTSEKILYAIFNLLDQFVKNDLEYFNCPSEYESLISPELKEKRDVYFEILLIHNWWFYLRKVDLINYQNEFKRWNNSLYDKEEAKKELLALQKMEDELNKKTEEMVLRLMKIRKYLCT